MRFRNALIPIITIFTLAICPCLISGAIIIESIFSLAGHGPAHCSNRSIPGTIPVIMGVTVLAAVDDAWSAISIADILYIIVDPAHFSYE